MSHSFIRNCCCISLTLQVSADVIHTASRAVTMHTPGRVQILTQTLTLTLAVYHASFVYTAGRVYSHYGKFHIIKDERLVSKWKVKLIFRGAYRLSGTGIVECLEIIGVECN